jgi:hypothetical protein
MTTKTETKNMTNLTKTGITESLYSKLEDENVGLKDEIRQLKAVVVQLKAVKENAELKAEIVHLKSEIFELGDWEIGYL